MPWCFFTSFGRKNLGSYWMTKDTVKLISIAHPVTFNLLLYWSMDKMILWEQRHVGSPALYPKWQPVFSSIIGWSAALLRMGKNCEVNCELFLQHLFFFSDVVFVLCELDLCFYMYLLWLIRTYFFEWKYENKTKPLMTEARETSLFLRES